MNLGMTKTLGKLDHVRRLCDDLRKASEAFITTYEDQSLVQNDETVDGAFDSVKSDLKRWLFKTLELPSSVEDFPPDLAMDALLRIYNDRFQKMRVFMPEQPQRVRAFVNSVIGKN